MQNIVFITGDRSMSLSYMPLVAIELLKAVKAEAQIVTGDNSGVEQLVREMCDRAGVTVTVLPTPIRTEDEKPNWNARHNGVKLNMPDALVVGIHSDPHASSVIKSLFEKFGDDEVTLVTPADLLV